MIRFDLSNLRTRDQAADAAWVRRAVSLGWVKIRKGIPGGESKYKIRSSQNGGVLNIEMQNK